MKKCLYIGMAAVLGAMCCIVQAQNARLEAHLVKALKMQENGQNRQAQPGTAVRALQQAGYLSKKPQQRADYVDFYLLRKPFVLYGQTLVLLQNEYFDRYVGCCVNPGLQLVFLATSNTTALAEFAEQNACSMDDNDDVLLTLKTYRIHHKLPKTQYVSLSCRKNDAAREGTN